MKVGEIRLRIAAIGLLVALVVAGCGDPRMSVYVRNESSDRFLISTPGLQDVVVGPNTEGIVFEDAWPEARAAEFELVDPTTCLVLDRVSLRAGRPHLIVVTNSRFVDSGEIDLGETPPPASLREGPTCPSPP
jgi:hypothetical protein